MEVGKKPSRFFYEGTREIVTTQLRINKNLDNFE